jgi:hypothetical protein
MNYIIAGRVRNSMIIAMEASSLNVLNTFDKRTKFVFAASGAGREPVQPGSRPATRFANAAYCPAADEPCCPSHDASCGCCCDFRSTQLLMRSIDWR